MKNPFEDRPTYVSHSGIELTEYSTSSPFLALSGTDGADTSLDPQWNRLVVKYYGEAALEVLRKSRSGS